MGRFFDALQRSQAERSGVDPSALPGATDLIDSAEKDAALEWETALKGHGKNIAQVYLENNEPPSAPELTESGEQETAVEWETKLRDFGKNITQIDFENNEPPGAIELMESGQQESVSQSETAPGNLGESIAQVDSENNEPPSTATAASADARTTPTITWPTPDPIAYGKKLTFAQLNATASVEGTFVYTPDPGYVLPVGTHTLWVKFIPADSGRYAPLQVATSIVVAKAKPTISWPKPAAIIYGAALGNAQLNAWARAPGSFDYSPAPGEVLPPGRHTLSVTFTPADSANYVAAQASVSLTVAKATSVIQWPTPEPITYGTRLSAAQLCAVAPVPGTFEYNPGLGAVLAAGEHNLSVVFTPADTSGFSISQAATSLVVAKATPAITWPAPDPIACGVALNATQLNATATVPGSFAYAPAAGEMLEPGVHELSLTFTPIDTLNYATARVVAPLTITEKLPIQITWPAPSAISYGTALSATQLNATASVPGTFVYTPSEGHVLARGKYILSASFTPSDSEKYAAAQATVALQVEGSHDNASSLAKATESPSARTISAINLAPENFNEAEPVNAREEWESRQAGHASSEAPKPLGQSVDRSATPGPLVDKPSDPGAASPAPVLIKQQALTSESVNGATGRAPRHSKASHTTKETPVAPGSPKLAKVQEIRHSPEPTETLRREAAEAPPQLFSSYKIKIKGQRKTAKKKWMAVAAVSFCAILVPLILIIPRFHLGVKSAAKPSVQPLPVAADTKPATVAPNPPALEPLTQEKPPATTESQPATHSQPTDKEGGANAPQVQTKVMSVQLTAPTRIPKPEKDGALPPASIDTAGAEGLGSGSANATMFNGHSQPNVKVASSKPLVISSGVATGMLIQRTPPDYPPLAKTAHVAGTVELHATISVNGSIKDLHVVAGPVMLRQAAVDAVRTWRYKPYKLNNQPVEVDTTINVVFTLGE